MIQIIDGAPAGVLAFKAVGEVDAKDYEDVLKPALERALAGGRKIRLVLEIGPEYEGSSGGGALGDMGVVLPHLKKCERCAVVTDRDWVERAVKGFGWMMGGRLRVFAIDRQAAAMAWAAGG
ncbi:MAG: STAS/SEC14 domain-containing protein [Actinomycetes bacterium]